jgi:hypothetical protein
MGTIKGNTTTEAKHMKAYIYKAPKAQQIEGKQYILQIQLTHREIVHTVPVQGVREGRKVAKQYNATPWNF